MFGRKKEKKYNDMNDEEKKKYLKDWEERQEKEEEETRIKRINFLESLLGEVKEDFIGYEKGYRITSIKVQDTSYHKPDTKTLSEITNMIIDRYKCKLHSFAVSENVYYFMFEK